MKYLFLLLVGLLCSFAGPPGAYATAHTPAVKAAAIYKHIRAVQAAVAYLAIERHVTARMLRVENPAPYASPLIELSAEATGATTATYLSMSGATLLVRPGWRSTVGSGFTQYPSPELRYS